MKNKKKTQDVVISQSIKALLPMDNGDKIEVGNVVDIICNGDHEECQPVPTMFIKMETPTKPFILFDNETPKADFSQYLMDKTCRQLECISHIKPSDKYNRLYNTVQSVVSQTNIFRLAYNLRMITAATLKAILYEVSSIITDIKPEHPDYAEEANYEKAKCIEQFEEVFSNIMMNFSHYRHPYALTIQKDSPYEDAYIMAEAVEQGNKISIELANKIFDTLYGVLFANLQAEIVAVIAEKLTPILALYRSNVISIFMQGTIEQSTMNYFDNISSNAQYACYDDDCDF